MSSSLPISIITPTYGRAALLPFAYQIYASQQDIAAREWIVIDDSPNPSTFMQHLADPSVRYIYLPQRLTTGEKRNLAIDAARGNIIVQFDDDEYYAPSYISAMLRVMHQQQADLIKLSAFFLYSFVYRKFGYWDLQNKTGLHFRWSEHSEKALLLDSPAELETVHLDFGFSYVFDKTLWQRSPFPETTFGEDSQFIQAALNHGYRVTLLKDDGDQCGLCLHLLHSFNSSDSLPQYVIPEFMARQKFPGFFGMLPEYTVAVQQMSQGLYHPLQQE